MKKTKGNSIIRKTALLLALILVLPIALGTAASAYTVEHRVSSGESLWAISKKYGVSFSSILSANSGLKNPNLIYPNQIIYVALPQSGNGGNSGGGNNSGSQASSGVQAEILRLTNQYRASYGLKALSLDSAVTKVAQEKANDMARNNYFSHTSPTYGSPFQMLKSFGVSYRAAGENIAKGYSGAKSVVEGWMNSEGHRANILNSSFTKLGVGYNSSGNYWVQIFVG